MGFRNLQEKLEKKHFFKQVSDDDDHEDSSEESESEEEEDEVMSSSHRHSIRAANPNPKQEKSRSGSPHHETGE